MSSNRREFLRRVTAVVAGVGVHGISSVAAAQQEPAVPTPRAVALMKAFGLTRPIFQQEWPVLLRQSWQSRCLGGWTRRNRHHHPYARASSNVGVDCQSGNDSAVRRQFSACLQSTDTRRRAGGGSARDSVRVGDTLQRVRR